MDELRRFCVRMLGEGSVATRAESEARAAAGEGREALLRAGVLAVRPHLAAHPGTVGVPSGEGLAAAVAAELRTATGRLTGAQRELLALRELIGLDHRQIAAVASLDATAVPSALAHARLDLRAALRGPGAPAGDCIERDRALETIARRQDGVEVAAADEDWLIAHLGRCPGCGRAHAAMLEASACYRAWAGDDGADAGAHGGADDDGGPAGAGPS